MFRRPALFAMPLLALALTGCGGASDSVSSPDGAAAQPAATTTSGPSTAPTPGSGETVSLNVVAYSVPKAAFDQLIPAFQATEAGRNVTIGASYGGSGDQSRKVESGLPADLVQFSLESDVTRLVKAGLVSESWKNDPHGGIPSSSVVTLVVRKGNPENIHDWDDLVRDGIEVVTPNPFSSGGAKWNLLAPFAVKSNGGQDRQAGLDFVKQVLEHSKGQPKSAREATELFESGTGDVLLSYESETLIAEKTNTEIEHVTPPSTFKIETPLAVVDKSAHLDQARSFRDFLYSQQGQRLWAEAGFRPADEAVAKEFESKFPAPQKLWSVADLGGWATLDGEMFAPDTGDIAKIYSEIGS